MTAYHALVQSHISYSVLAWGNSHASIHIFRLQRRAIRVFAGLGYREDCRDAFVSLGILTLPCVYIFQAVLRAYVNRNNFLTHADIHTYNTRKKDNMYIQYCRLSITQQSPTYMGQVLFNKLPTQIRLLTLTELKIKLKSHLIRNAFYSVEEFLNCDFV